MSCICTIGVLQKGVGKGFVQKSGARDHGTHFGASLRKTGKNRSYTLSITLHYY